MLALALASLAMAHVLTPDLPQSSFFLLHTRAWEFLAGVLAAVWMSSRAAPSGLAAQMLSALGLLAIAVAVFEYDRRYSMPSLWTLLPVLGAVGICMCATPGTWVARGLSIGPFVWVGRISYSAYLWHLPIFTFGATLGPEASPSISSKATLIVATLLVAWGSWRFIEQPYRRRDVWTRRQVFVQAVGSTAILIVLGLAAIFARGVHA